MLDSSRILFDYSRQGWHRKDWGGFNHLVLIGLNHLILTNFDWSKLNRGKNQFFSPIMVKFEQNFGGARPKLQIFLE